MDKGRKHLYPTLPPPFWYILITRRNITALIISPVIRMSPDKKIFPLLSGWGRERLMLERLGLSAYADNLI